MQDVLQVVLTQKDALVTIRLYNFIQLQGTSADIESTTRIIIPWADTIRNRYPRGLSNCKSTIPTEDTLVRNISANLAKILFKCSSHWLTNLITRASISKNLKK